MSETVISVRGLTKRFGSLAAVDDVTMTIRRGQVHGFIGPNGSGKTTAIRMMCGLMDPTSGTVTVLDMPVPEKAAEVRRHVGYMTQRFSLYEDMTVRENMRFLCRINGIRGKRLKSRIEEVLDQFNLEPLADKRVGPMSGGQKRRIALGAAVLTEPELLILDEPTSEVDPNTRGEMWEHFFKLAQSGTTLLVSTHLMDEAERCHHLTIMNRGKVVADGTVRQLKDELPARVLQVDGEEVTHFIPRLNEVKGVVKVNQVGLSLRVLVESIEVKAAVQAAIPAEAEVEPVPASIEDVFVNATRGSRRA